MPSERVSSPIDEAGGRVVGVDAFRPGQEKPADSVISGREMSGRTQGTAPRVRGAPPDDEDKLERMMLCGQSAGCRWRTLPEYFHADDVGEVFRCGTCDNCMRPRELELAAPTSLPHPVQ
jgi:RecQ helicase-like protein